MVSNLSRSFSAKYGDQECAVCGEEILKGDMVCFYDEDLVHEACAEEQHLKWVTESTKDWTPRWRR